MKISLLLPLCLLFSTTLALDLDINDQDSICSAAGTVVNGMLDYYDGKKYGGVVGMFQAPYYWWEAGHAWGGVLDYWYYCQNDSVEDVLYSSLMAQRGNNNDFIPKNQSTTEGNDDQGFWGIFVMSAAERNFTEPKDKDVPDWLSMSQAVYNTMWERWDSDSCSGGLRWQIFTWNSGYDHKNTVSNACLFQMASRLARFTGNDSYVETAETVYQWLIDTQFVVDGDKAYVYDGADISNNCSDIVKLEWSYNYGLLIGGAAYLYNYTESDDWLQKLTSLVNGAKDFFKDDIMYERACQGADNCNNDQRSFKAVFSRALGMTTRLVPSLYDEIRPLLESSAEAAAKSCSGGSDGVTCGLDWTKGSWDNKYGLGEQMCALEIFNSLLAPESPAPYNHENEGVGQGNVDAGKDSDSTSLDRSDLKIETKDRAGAAIVTAICLLILIIGSIWMIM
ncbi:Mannan endo-1,6-alpha-mannosidase [Wickerhamomyces ciferrii]|uniref:Mannan endo-1,6-alpha-mannosidase n=1 Tax=Wickerhamomyces ciferrii (strain ATCC 14091 / BCRC 22168 / CBS 111 / JCM 3599 / NBRC 0793 / NRRL Y-1031 F-60-10) TaxID=1206466 RepID=K0KX41_WICCF|nr:Mannan endo-1,6-alpha-mannosidase [Wickerhamomyces ciferrii]CCH46054.1 Mannan endo-1,6-alpha-mannosidase [Wickerhamomyces ciferrii]